ncbi:hypothetical protein TARUN_1783 [Trichoderma arundinaceum]|uniref:Uncharacterized protein n=1 Tax=Trichoderma arundinaceum TaxID=490622 RepID=A0A395NWJ0_TRIAR|nr:hypothetical protein TARUN_1783 [Trichoderma arundinaceum]
MELRQTHSIDGCFDWLQLRIQRQRTNAVCAGAVGGYSAAAILEQSHASAVRCVANQLSGRLACESGISRLRRFCFEPQCRIGEGEAHRQLQLPPACLAERKTRRHILPGPDPCIAFLSLSREVT